jgi:hypothetical protein
MNQHEWRAIKGFPPQPSMIMVSSRAYQKLSSNGLDLVELELLLFFPETVVKIEFTL